MFKVRKLEGGAGFSAVARGNMSVSSNTCISPAGQVTRYGKSAHGAFTAFERPNASLTYFAYVAFREGFSFCFIHLSSVFSPVFFPGGRY